MCAVDLSPEDVKALIQYLEETRDAHSDPATIEKLNGFIAILTAWLRSGPSWRTAWRVLGEILEWAVGGRPVSGLIETTTKLILGLWDKTFLSLPLGGSAAAVAAAAAFMVIGLAMLGVSIYKAVTAPRITLVAGPPCGTAPAATGLGPESDWGVLSNQRGLYDNVMKKAQADCDAYQSKCTGKCTAPAVCKPNVSLQDYDITDYLVYRTVTFIKFDCTCECL